jgi:hypothetical protein
MNVARDLSSALEYARRHGLQALVIARGGDLLLQEYSDG